MRHIYNLAFVASFIFSAINSYSNDYFSASYGFIENKGQIITTQGKPCNEVLFKSSNKGIDIYLTKKGICYVYSKIENETIEKGDFHTLDTTSRKISLFRMDMELIGSNPNCNVVTKEESNSITNYYYPHCQDGIKNVKKFRKITYQNIYPFIDWVVYFSKSGSLKYDFVVHPRGNPNDIKFKYLNADSLSDSKDKINLTAKNNYGSVSDENLFLYQGKNKINGRFGISKDYNFFEIDEYDKGRDLIIDPYLTWSTYFGGSLNESNGSLKIDPDNNVVISGTTLSTNFPVLGFSSAYNDNTHNGSIDFFYSKFSNDGQQIWTTYYGGSGDDKLEYLGRFLDIDSLGNIYVTGSTYSVDFPISSISGAFFQANRKGNSDAFILKFDKDGKRIFSTYLGGSYSDLGTVVKVAPGGSIYVMGCTFSPDFLQKSLSGAFNQGTFGGATSNNSSNGYIVRLNPDLTINWSTYFGGYWGTSLSDITFDNLGNFFIAGWGDNYGGNNIPLLDLGNGAYYQNAPKGLIDGIITRFNKNSQLEWCTYFGGSGNATPQSGYDGFQHIVYNKLDNTLYLTSQAAPTNFPILSKSGAFNKATCSGARDIGITQFSTSGKLLWSTYFGGTETSNSSTTWETPTGIAISRDGKLWVAGSSNATNLTTTSDGTYFKSYNSGNRETIILKFNSNGGLEYSTYFGGANDEDVPTWSSNFDIDSNNNVFFTGITNSSCTTISSGFPLYNPGNGTYYQGNIAGGFDSYILKFSPKPVSGTGNICSLPVQTICTISSNISTNSPVCFGKTLLFTPTNSTASGYYWSGPNGFTSTSTSISIPNATTSLSGTYKLTISSPGCIDLIKTITGTVFPDVSSSITVSGIKNSYCSNDYPTTVSGFPSGGLWKGKGISGLVYRPSMVGSGKDTVTYTVVQNGCTGTSVNFIDVIASPSATITGLNNAYCLNASQVTITGIDSGGSFLGKGINGNTFTASLSGIGIDSISYTVKINGCTSNYQQLVQINPIPTASISGLNKNYCIDSSPTTLTGFQSGGIWKGKGMIASTYHPQIAGIGKDTVTYISSALGCTNTTSSFVQVFPLPSITISGLSANYCINGQSTSLAALPVGGQWKGRGISIDNYIPSQSGIGKDTVSYSVTLNGCTNTVTSYVQVNPLPIASIIGLSTSYCSNSNATTISGTPLGGTFFGNSVIGNTYNPTLVTNGLDSVKYVVSVNGCTNTTTSFTTIYKISNFSISGINTSYCFNSPTITLTGLPLGGTWQGKGISGNLLTVSLAGVGFDTLSYLPVNNLCSSGASKIIEIKPLPSISLAGLASEYCDNHQDILISYLPINSTVVGKGMIGNYFKPRLADIGVNTVTVSSDLNGCHGQAEYKVTIQKTDTAKIVGLAPYYCKTDSPALLKGYPSGGIFSSNVKSNLYYPSLSIFNTDTVHYYFTSFYPCLIPAKQGTYISSNPIVTFTGLNNLVCNDNQTVTLTGIPSGGSFFGKGIFNNTFSSQLAGEGWHKIGYFFTNSYGCSDTSYGGSYVEYLLELPNIFTPNGDGKNDKLVVKGLQSEAQIEVTNRWGNVVYQNKNYKNDWEADGIADGIYFYRITNNGHCKPESSGWLQITR